MKPDPHFPLDMGQATPTPWPEKSGRMKYRVIFAIVAVAAGVLAWQHFSPSDKDPAIWKTQPIQRGDITIRVTATGTLYPVNEVQVGSELSGMVKWVHVDYNDRVRQEQVLAVLDTTKLDAQTAQSRASLEAAEARVMMAQATFRETGLKLEQYRTLKNLSQGRMPSRSDLDTAEAAHERARSEKAAALAAVSQARAALEAYETDLLKSEIRSPINGIVMDRNIEPGQTVAASFQAPVLFTLAEDLSRMELRVNVDEADIGRVREGQEALFSVDAYMNRSFEATITRIHYGSQTVNGVVTYPTVLRVDNSDLSLRPGMTATADIIVQETKNVLQIPNTALRFNMPDETGDSRAGGLVGAILPRPPTRVRRQPEKTMVQGSAHQVWTLKENRPVPVTVIIGLTDGIMTEVLGGECIEGMALITQRAVRDK